SAPGARAARIDGNRRVILALIRNSCEHVRQDRAGAAGESAAGPGFGLPARDGPVFLGADLDLGIRRRPHAGDGQLGGAVEKELDRLAAAFLREIGALDAPAVGGELAAEASADMVHVDLDLGGGQLQGLGYVACHAGDVLRGWPVLYAVA